MFVTQSELLEDPRDKIATFLLASTQDFGGRGKAFVLSTYESMQLLS